MKTEDIDQKVLEINQKIKAKEAEIEKLKTEIIDLKVKEINLLQKSKPTQEFDDIENTCIDFAIKHANFKNLIR